MIELDWNEEEPCGHECSHCEQECEGMEEHFLDDGQGDEEDKNSEYEEDDDENRKYDDDM